MNFLQKASKGKEKLKIVHVKKLRIVTVPWDEIIEMNFLQKASNYFVPWNCNYS
jgi:hypothetical protein